MNPAAADAARSGGPLQVTDFAQWRVAARELLRANTPPESANWDTLDGGDLFSSAPAAAALPHPSSAASPDTPSAARLPRSLLEMLRKAACFRAPDRWAFLYRVLWRWQQGEHDVQSPADPDGARLYGMVKAVRREEHDMHAYVRFRERPVDAGAPRFVAWFEPAHDVLPQVAEHFIARMGKVSWMIATPEASVLWDGATLHSTGPLMSSAADLEDAGEALWLTYYRSIFNPARVNARLMQSHIPSRFWKNLPEGAIVPAMVSQAELGARKIGQLQSVGRKGGATIPISAERAQPDREQPSRLDECRRCELWQHATQAVPGAGPQHAPIMLVGEQPGDQEDLAGTPFVGPAGKLLDRVFAQAGVERGACTSPTRSSTSSGSPGASAASTRHRPNARSRPAITGSKKSSRPCNPGSSSRWVRPRSNRCWARARAP
jgi:uracil-DNA glycosylase